MNILALHDASPPQVLLTTIIFLLLTSCTDPGVGYESLRAHISAKPTKITKLRVIDAKELEYLRQEYKHYITQNNRMDEFKSNFNCDPGILPRRRLRALLPGQSS